MELDALVYRYIKRKLREIMKIEEKVKKLEAKLDSDHHEVFSRLNRLEEQNVNICTPSIKQPNEVRPYKCPICEGKGSITWKKDGMTGGYTCVSCKSGIVWR